MVILWIPALMDDPAGHFPHFQKWAGGIDC